MDDVGIAAGHGAPPSVLRRLALGEGVAPRAASHAHLAEDVLRRRAPKLLHASTRIAPPAEIHDLTAPAAPSPPADDSAVVERLYEPTGPQAVAAPPAAIAEQAAPPSDEAVAFRTMMRQRYN